MGSGGTTALLPPGKFCFIRPLLRSDLICIRLKILSHPPKQPSCHSPFRLRNCWEGRSVRASSLLRQLAKGGCAARRLSWVTPGFSQSRRCKTTASAKLACRSTKSGKEPNKKKALLKGAFFFSFIQGFLQLFRYLSQNQGYPDSH